MGLKFQRYLLFRCRVREDRLLVSFLKRLESIKCDVLEVDEEYRRVVFKIDTYKILGLKQTLDYYLKRAYYEAYSLSSRFNLNDTKLFLENLRMVSEKLEKTTVKGNIRAVFILKMKPVIGELFKDRGGYRIKLKCMRSNIQVKILDPLLPPASTYTFSYNPSAFNDEIDWIIRVLRDSEVLVEQTVNGKTLNNTSDSIKR